MHLHAAASRRRLGELLGAAPGHALAAEADQWMREQTIRHPAQMASVYVPGFARSGGPSGESKTLERDSV